MTSDLYCFHVQDQQRWFPGYPSLEDKYNEQEKITLANLTAKGFCHYVCK